MCVCWCQGQLHVLNKPSCVIKRTCTCTFNRWLHRETKCIHYTSLHVLYHLSSKYIWLTECFTQRLSLAASWSLLSMCTQSDLPCIDTHEQSMYVSNHARTIWTVTLAEESRLSSLHSVSSLGSMHNCYASYASHASHVQKVLMFWLPLLLAPSYNNCLVPYWNMITVNCLHCLYVKSKSVCSMWLSH